MTANAPWLEELRYDDCLALLRANGFGRLALMVDEYPLILPINYRLVETSARTWLALRTRAGGLVDRASLPVAFEIDGADPFAKQGWSVVVRGTLHDVDLESADFAERFDPEPWLEDRDSWLIIDSFSITGRRLHAASTEWIFHVGEYL